MRLNLHPIARYDPISNALTHLEHIGLSLSLVLSSLVLVMLSLVSLFSVLLIETKTVDDFGALSDMNSVILNG